jgi:hypothetical protein
MARSSPNVGSAGARGISLIRTSNPGFILCDPFDRYLTKAILSCVRVA